MSDVMVCMSRKKNASSVSTRRFRIFHFHYFSACLRNTRCF